MLLAGAALLVRSFNGFQADPLGIETRGVVTASISLNRYEYATPQAKMQFFLEAEQAVKKLPGVEAVGIGDTVPPGGYRRDHIYSIMEVRGRPPLTGDRALHDVQILGAQLLATALTDQPMARRVAAFVAHDHRRSAGRRIAVAPCHQSVDHREEVAPLWCEAVLDPVALV